MIETTSVKLFKVGTIMPRDHHAKLHVIAVTVASVHWEVRERAASSERFCAVRNDPPRTQ